MADIIRQNSIRFQTIQIHSRVKIIPTKTNVSIFLWDKLDYWWNRRYFVFDFVKYSNMPLTFQWLWLTDRCASNLKFKISLGRCFRLFWETKKTRKEKWGFPRDPRTSHYVCQGWHRREIFFVMYFSCSAIEKFIYSLPTSNMSKKLIPMHPWPNILRKRIIMQCGCHTWLFLQLSVD